jgi:hypothetical protein
MSDGILLLVPKSPHWPFGVTGGMFERPGSGIGPIRPCLVVFLGASGLNGIWTARILFPPHEGDHPGGFGK